MATECCYIPKRYILVCFAHLGFFVSFALRVNLSVALVAMVNDTQTDNTTTSVTGKVSFLLLIFYWIKKRSFFRSRAGELEEFKFKFNYLKSILLDFNPMFCNAPFPPCPSF